MAMMDLECSINSIDKAEAEFERMTPSLKEVLLLGNMLLNSIAYYKKLFMKESILQLYVIVVYYKNLHPVLLFINYLLISQ